MAIGCINRNSAEYQHLKRVSGISEFHLDRVCEEFLDKFNRFPRLDELPGSDSSNYLKNYLKLDSNDSTSISNILETLLVLSIEEAIIKLNRIYSDSEVNILPIVDKAIVTIKRRPTDEYKYIELRNEINPKMSNPIVITKALNKLADLYGIKVNLVSNEDINQIPELTTKDKLANAFILNGEIYINTDRFSPDSFIHEMLHLLVGSLRFSNPNLYSLLIQSSELFINYQQLIRNYKDKTRNDANEELFVSLLANYLSGLPSLINNLTEELIYEINYNVLRVLDSMLMGDFSSTIMEDLYNSTFKDVVEGTNSDILTSKFSSENATLHRLLNNLKSDLIKRGELTEICE